MTPELESRIYGSVLRAVMWGTERGEIIEMLQVNGITGESAETMVSRARNERVAVLRSEAIRKAAKGALFLAAGIGLFSLFWFGFGVIFRIVFVLCGLLGAWGLWAFLDGTVSALLASIKKGPVEADGN